MKKLLIFHLFILFLFFSGCETIKKKSDEVVKKEIRRGVEHKEYNLFDTRTQANKYLKTVVKMENENRTIGSIKDGNIKVFDTEGVMRREYEINSF